MNQFLRKIWGWIPAVIFLVGIVLVSIPHLYLQRWWNAYRGADAATQRRTETAWQYSWARFYDRIVCMILDIKMPIHVQGRIARGKPSIILFNHRTAMDHPKAALVLKELHLGHTLWIVKSQMRSVLGMGESCARAGHAFVTRNGDHGDKDRVRELARIARRDRASVALYPEGTRYDGFPQEDGEYRHLRDPKRGGLQILLDELPEYDQVIFVCLDWRGLRGGKQLFDGDGLIGIRGRITVWALQVVPGDTAQTILEEGWTRMDELLSSPL